LGEGDAVSLKVGIATIHRIFNYGSALQAYALQKRIHDFGHHCETIDYIYPNQYHQALIGKVSRPRRGLLGRARRAVGDIVVRRKKRERRFAKFLSQHVLMSANQYESKEVLHQGPPSYDVYVVGSDQVWNVRRMGEDYTFLLDFAPAGAKRVAYAASFGDSRIDTTSALQYRKRLEKFHRISVREAESVDQARELSGLEACSVLDPTMLLSADEWQELAVLPKRPDKYVLCYFLGYTFNPFPYAEELANHVAKMSQCRLVYLVPPVTSKIFEKNVTAVFDAGPLEFLGLFANAEAVITTSFHGTAFAVTFNRPLFSIVDDAPTRPTVASGVSSIPLVCTTVC
jgi:hypothetical protein